MIPVELKIATTSALVFVWIGLVADTRKTANGQFVSGLSFATTIISIIVWLWHL